MTLLYTKEQKALIKLVHDVAEQELKPYVAEADRAGECPAELYEFGFDLGLHLVEVPKEYGGTGLDYETTAMIFEELAKVDAGYAITFVTTFVALRNVILAGTPEQAQYFADVVKRASSLPLRLLSLMLVQMLQACVQQRSKPKKGICSTLQKPSSPMVALRRSISSFARPTPKQAPMASLHSSLIATCLG